MSSNNWTWSYYMSSSSCLWKIFLRDITQHTSHVGTYLLFSFLGDDPEPVSNHTEHSGKVCQAHHDPETHHRLVVVQVLWTLWPTCRTKDTKKKGLHKAVCGLHVSFTESFWEEERKQAGLIFSGLKLLLSKMCLLTLILSFNEPWSVSEGSHVFLL